MDLARSHAQGAALGPPFWIASLSLSLSLVSDWPAQGWGARPFIFFSQVQTGLPRELAKLLTVEMATLGS